MSERPIEIQVHQRLSDIGQDDWDSCACPETADGGRALDPFTTYRFLAALEDSGSVGPGSGWQPRYLTAHLDGQLIACAPLYGKSHSQGEYVFDYAWANAYENAGGRYYPKFQIAVPFTPVNGRRILCKPGFETAGQAAVVQALAQLTADNGLSSAHITFCTAEEADAGKAMGLLHRSGQQFHWLNHDYKDFTEFLTSLSSRKRKTMRKERAQAQSFGGIIRTYSGEDIVSGHWDAMWAFYQDTGARKWGTPYLNRSFFEIAHETLRDDIVLVFAERDGVAVAGAMNMWGRDTLYGRYWGCIEHHPCLHFEVCYYQAIDFAIAHGLAKVEAGAQGEHKLARGYMPTETHSLHWIADAGFRRAIDEYLDAERAAVAEEIEILTSYGPFRKKAEEDHE